MISNQIQAASTPVGTSGTAHSCTGATGGTARRRRTSSSSSLVRDGR